jgi:putative transposase
VITYVELLLGKTELSLKRVLHLFELHKGKYFHWVKRHGTANHHNHALPKSGHITPAEREIVLAYAQSHYAANDFFLRDGYRRLSFRMMDEQVAYISPSSVYRILREAGLINKWKTAKSGTKGDGFVQPTAVHEHWHTDIKYVSFHGTFLFLITVIDGYSRFIVHHELRTSMDTTDVSITIQKALDKFPGVKPRLISDNGSQYTSKEFERFMANAELMHIKTSIAYPQSNGKIERWHKSLSQECLHTTSFITLEDAREQIGQYVVYYNTVRLHSALKYLTPDDYFCGREEEKLRIRSEALHAARLSRSTYWNRLAA